VGEGRHAGVSRADASCRDLRFYLLSHLAPRISGWRYVPAIVRRGRPKLTSSRPGASYMRSHLLGLLRLVLALIRDMLPESITYPASFWNETRGIHADTADAARTSARLRRLLWGRWRTYRRSANRGRTLVWSREISRVNKLSLLVPSHGYGPCLASAEVTSWARSAWAQMTSSTVG
jgi:hypothetical protein